MTSGASGVGTGRVRRPVRTRDVRRVVGGLLLSATLLHFPYVLWLAAGPPGGVGSSLRSLAALAALLLLIWLRRSRATPGDVGGVELGGARAPVVTFAVVIVVAVVAGLGAVWPALWAASLPGLVIAGARASLWSPRLGRHPLLPLLALSVFPVERWLAPALDLTLQGITARAAGWLVNLTGLPVELVSSAGLDPVLVNDNLRVTVTALCAGTQTLSTLWTLGLVIAEIFLRGRRIQALFVLLTPFFGFGGNVLRVAVSTHAASRWAGSELTWAIAHDLIGYLAFASTYLLLILLVRRLRRAGRTDSAPLASEP